MTTSPARGPLPPLKQDLALIGRMQQAALTSHCCDGRRYLEENLTDLQKQALNAFKHHLSNEKLLLPGHDDDHTLLRFLKVREVHTHKWRDYPQLQIRMHSHARARAHTHTSRTHMHARAHGHMHMDPPPHTCTHAAMHTC